MNMTSPPSPPASQTTARLATWPVLHAKRPFFTTRTRIIRPTGDCSKLTAILLRVQLVPSRKVILRRIAQTSGSNPTVRCLRYLPGFSLLTLRRQSIFDTLHNLQHPNIEYILGMFTGASNAAEAFFVLPCAENVSLRHYLNNHRPANRRQLVRGTRFALQDKRLTACV